MLTTNLLISSFLVWCVCPHAADGRYVDADDFTMLAAEVAAMKQERFEFNERITELEMKLGAREAKLKAVEEKLITETKAVSTEEKLRAVEGQLNDARLRIDELERNPELSRDQEVTHKETNEQRPDEEAYEWSEVATETHIQKTDDIREHSNDGNLRTVSKRIVPTTTPRIAFSAYLNTRLANLGSQHPIKFDGVTLNQGNGYDATMSDFLCPVSGVYMFQSALLSMPYDHIETEIVKDGAALVRLYAAGSTASNGHDQGFNSVITSCSQGEHVWVRAAKDMGTSVNGNVQVLSKRIVPTASPHIAFSAYLYHHLSNVANQHPIKFDGVYLNQGNGYDAILSVFICPVSGVYVFQSALLAMYQEHIETEIVKDGAAIVRLYAAGSTAGDGYDQGFNSVITTCNQGEHVWVRVHETHGTVINGGLFSTFSGYLLWEN